MKDWIMEIIESDLDMIRGNYVWLTKEQVVDAIEQTIKRIREKV